MGELCLLILFYLYFYVLTLSNFFEFDIFRAVNEQCIPDKFQTHSAFLALRKNYENPVMC